MPGQEYPDLMPEATDSPDTQAPQASPSRRSVLRRGTIAGALGLAVAAGGGSAVAAVMSSKSQGNSSTQAADTASSGPIVIYMADPTSGEMDIFAGTGRTKARNHAMASMVASMAPR